MKLKKYKNKKGKMERKKFFYSIGLGFLGALATKNILFRFFSSEKFQINKPKVSNNTRVKINPLAVSRNKNGANNV